MTRIFFDVQRNGVVMRDEVGQDMPDVEAVRAEAMSSLPSIAQSELETDGDRQDFVVIARNEAGKTIYSASLSYVGLKLSDEL